MLRSTHRLTVVGAISVMVLLLMSVSVSASAPVNGALATGATPPNASPFGPCALALIPAADGLSGAVVDCTTVHLAEHGDAATGDDAATQVSSPALAEHGWLSSEVIGTCAGCDTAFGSGSGYRAFVRLQDATSGEFISVGLIHDSGVLAAGDDATGLTVMIETGRMVGNALDVQCGYLSSATNRVPNGRATLRLSWTEQGVAVALDGIVPSGENAPRPLVIGTYAVQIAHPVASFGSTTKDAGAQVDATFSAIATG